jgi:hypothetical protein
MALGEKVTRTKAISIGSGYLFQALPIFSNRLEG